MRRALLSLAAFSLFACSGGTAPTPAEPPKPATIPITSSSPQALDHFTKGRVAFGNLRVVDAEKELAQAIALDPGFVTAHALHGTVTPGAEGVAEMQKAAADASKLPEAERVFIEALLADRQGDVTKGVSSWTRLTELAPGDSDAFLGLGGDLFTQQKYEAAAAALKKGTEINSNAGPAMNLLGYALMRQGNIEGAIDAFKKYVAANPQEPNPQDSLGEALLAAGRFGEAEAAFRKATEVSPAFWNGWDGVAYTKFYQGDWAGGQEALAKAKAATTRPVDAIAVQSFSAVASLAADKAADALKTLDAAEKTPGAKPTDVTFIPLTRAFALILANRHRDAIAQANSVLDHLDAMPAGLARNAQRVGLTVRAMAECSLKDAAAVEKTAAAADQMASSRPDDVLAQSAAHFIRGVLAETKGDFKGAASVMAGCSAEDSVCQFQLIEMSEKAGDKAGATAARERFMRFYVRDPFAMAVRSHLGGIKAPSAKAS